MTAEEPKKTTNKKSTWTTEEEELLINEWSHYECLYNTSCSDFKREANHDLTHIFRFLRFLCAIWRITMFNTKHTVAASTLSSISHVFMNIISPDYPNILGHLWCHETHVSTNENACFGWSVVFHNKPKRFKMADTESRMLSNAINAGLQEVYISLDLSPNFEIKGKFAFAFHATDNSTQITIILGRKEALRNAI